MLVTELSPSKAREFFMRGSVYTTLNFPPYIDFNPILQACAGHLEGKPLRSFLASDGSNTGSRFLNVRVVENKAGRNSWRTSELVHPLAYVDLVNILCDEENWAELKAKFREFVELPKFHCSSVPQASMRISAVSIRRWLVEHESESLSHALRYKVMAETDISNCYNSIYTHSISWALHGLDVSKNKKAREGLLGTKLDDAIRFLQWDQSVGIPQGSLLMDLIAELVLGYLDQLISEKLSQKNIQEYEILRFRDDYRVFTNTNEEAETILHIIALSASSLGFSLNASKTRVSQDLLASALKPDKLPWKTRIERGDLVTRLLLLHEFATKYPQTRRLRQGLMQLAKVERRGLPRNRRNLWPNLAVAVQLAYNNPAVFVEASTLITRLLSRLKKSDRGSALLQIQSKFSGLPDAHINHIWMQRVTYSDLPDIPFSHPVCKRVADPKFKFWEDDWVASPKIKSSLRKIDIVDRRKLKKLKTVVSLKEAVEMFNSGYLQ